MLFPILHKALNVGRHSNIMKLKIIAFLGFQFLILFSKGQKDFSKIQLKSAASCFNSIIKGNFQEYKSNFEKETLSSIDNLYFESEFLNTRKEYCSLDTLLFKSFAVKKLHNKNVFVYNFDVVSKKTKTSGFIKYSIEFGFNQNSTKVYYYNQKKARTFDKYDSVKQIFIDTSIIISTDTSIIISRDTLINFKNEQIQIISTSLLSLSSNASCYNVILEYTLPLKSESRKEVAFSIADYIKKIFANSNFYQIAEKESIKLSRSFEKKVMITFSDFSREEFNIMVDFL